MMHNRAEQPDIELPDDKANKPVWTKVGVIAVIGFVIGIAWPRIAGIQLGPTPPQEGRASASAEFSSSSPSSLPGAVAGAVPGAAAGAAVSGASSAELAAQPPTTVQTQTVVVKHTSVLTCRDDNNKAVETCDRPDLDALLMPIVKNLEKCPASAGLAGKLSIGFDVDFQRNRVQALQGRSTTIPTDTVSGIWNCVGEDVKRLRLGGMRHDQRRYTLFYAAFFYPPGKVLDADNRDDEPRRDGRQPVASAQGQEEGQNGQSAQGGPSDSSLGFAQIVYDTALVRDAPKTGNVIARLVRGTRVELIGRKDSWYQIRVEGREGWIYRGALAQ